MNERVTPQHLDRKAMLYVRQSSTHQVKNNQESGRLQYAMQDRLTELGWSEIEVIDEDLGRTASGAVERTGFQRLVAEVCLGNVGVVAAREASRLARNNRDWHQLIEMCCLVDTLLVDHETVYNPRAANDRLLLGLKGSLSEYELDLLRLRAAEARHAKATRGEFISIAPTGYVKTVNDRLEKDPDRRVQEIICLAYEKVLELGSVRQALLWFIGHGLELPVRRRGLLEWETAWRRPNYCTLLRLVRNPVYAGSYTYGRTMEVTKLHGGVPRKTRVLRPMGEYLVLIHDHHEGYVPRDLFDRVQEMISNNTLNKGNAGPGAPKLGLALLAGLLRCRRCGRKLVVGYTGNNRRVPRYGCIRGALDQAEPRCISFGGTSVDEALAAEVLRLLQPAAIEAAAEAARQARHEGDGVLDTLDLELQAARHAADRARRQYDGVDPGNRLVADELEERWNAALTKVAEFKRRIADEEHHRHGLVQPEGKEVLGLADDLDRVWDDPNTDMRLKKRIVRALVEEIIVDLDAESSEVLLVVHWKGGVHSELRVRRRRRGRTAKATSESTIDAIRTLALACTDETIACFLSRSGLKTGKGNRWTRERVASARSRRKIPRYDPDLDDGTEWLKLNEAAEHVGVSARTLRLEIDRGNVEALHPLSSGPWLIRKEILDTSDARRLFERYRRPQNGGAGLGQEQLDLME